MEALKKSMDPHIDVVEESFRKLEIDGIPIEVRKYPEDSFTKVLMDALVVYGSEYR